MITYQTCRPDEGGKPKCGLASGCSSIELKGMFLSDIEGSKDSGQKIYSGQTKADVLILAENVDYTDDRVGYIGNHKSFQKLMDFVKKSGLNPNKTFLTYMVRCKTGFKKKATVQQIKACAPHLEHEITSLEPKVILLLGNAPLRPFKLQGKGGINALRGKIFHLPISEGGPTYKVIPTLDPGAFFHHSDPQLERSVLDDYILANKVSKDSTVQANKVHFAPYKVIRTHEDLDNMISKIKETNFFSFDTESRGLPWHKEPMICMSFCHGVGESYVLPIYQHELNTDEDQWQLKPFWNNHEYKNNDLFNVFNKLKEIFESNIPKAAHNLKYDMCVLRKHAGIEIKGFIFDTMLMHHILCEQPPHDLEYLARIEFSVGDYSHDLHQITGYGKELKKTYDWVPDEILWPYAATDAECCYRLAKLYYNRLVAKPSLWKLYCDEPEQATKSLFKAEWYGHKMDFTKYDILLKECEDKQLELETEIKSATWPEFKADSYRDVTKAIIAAGYGDAIRNDKKVSGYETSKDKLGEIKHELPLANNILQFRNMTKLIGTYLVNIKEGADQFNRLRTSWMIHGTVSGRYSCRLFHQIPRADRRKVNNLRDMFICDDGYEIVYFDYSQIELRLLAQLAKDIAMINLFAQGVDIHQMTASIMLNWGFDMINEFNRQNCGKNVNFGLGYGSTGFQIVQKGEWEDHDGKRYPITWEMMNRGMARFHQRFPQVAEYLNSVPMIARSQGNVYVTPFGRELRIGDKLNDWNEKSRAAAEREIVNRSIQSPAGGITNRTINIVDSCLDNFIVSGKLKETDAFLINTVHDSGAWEVRKGLVPWFKGIVKEIAERKIPELDNAIFPCAVGSGRSATEAELNSKL